MIDYTAPKRVIKPVYDRYVEIFKWMKLADEGYSVLSYEDWTAAPKRNGTIMPLYLPKRSKAQVAGFEAWLAAVRATGLVRAIIHYSDGSKWLYMKEGAYNGSGTLAVCMGEYDAMCKVLGHHLLRGHDSRGLSFGRRKGKSPVEWITSPPFGFHRTVPYESR
jgi:hypothetical protein